MSSGSLAYWQTWMRDAIVGREAPPTDTAPELTRGLAIYRDAYRLRLHEVLAIDFPVLRGYLGEVVFTQLCTAYVDSTPAVHYSVRWYGRDLPAFLATRRPWAGDVFAAEIARFEWCLGEAFDAADAAVASAAELAGIAPARWPELRMRLHPSVRRVGMSSNIMQYWGDYAAGRWSTPIESTAPAAWVIWRAGLAVRFRCLGEVEDLALTGAGRSLSMEELSLELVGCVDMAEVPAQLARYLADWSAAGLVSEWVVAQ